MCLFGERWFGSTRQRQRKRNKPRFKGAIMTKKVLIACVTAAFISAVALGQNNTQVMNVVEITKIDSKKMTLSVKSDLADGASLSGRGGLPAGGGRGGARGGY